MVRQRRDVPFYSVSCSCKKIGKRPVWPQPGAPLDGACALLPNPGSFVLTGWVLRRRYPVGV